MKTLIVIVLYKCKLADSRSYCCLKQDVSETSDFSFFIYDNSPNPDIDAIKILEGYNDSFYIHDKSNPGISKAYNAAALYAKKNHFDWLLLLDQDTHLPNGILKDYTVSRLQNRTIEMFVPKVKIASQKYISPTLFHCKQGRIMKFIPHGVLECRKYSVINSGIMISTNAFWSVGGYNERVYLDFNDHEFFERFKRKYKYIFVLDRDLLQDFSCISKDVNTLINRYFILCDCVKNIKKSNISDRFFYSIMLLKRAIHLFVITHRFSVLKIFIKYFSR